MTSVWRQHRHTVTVTFAKFFWQFCWSWVWELIARLPWDFWDFLTACCLCLCCQHRQHHHRHRHHYGQHCRLVLMGRRAKGLELSRIFWPTHFKTMPLCTLFFLGLCHRLCHLVPDCNKQCWSWGSRSSDKSQSRDSPLQCAGPSTGGQILIWAAIQSSFGPINANTIFWSPI